MKKSLLLCSLMLTALYFVGCKRTFEVKDVNVCPNYELIYGLVQQLDFDRDLFKPSKGDVRYKAMQELAIQKVFFSEDDDDEKDFFSVDDLGEEIDYTIISNENGGYKLGVEASLYKGNDNYYYNHYLYHKITFVHPLCMSHDSVVCNNLKFKMVFYGPDEFPLCASRPISGEIKVYHVDGEDKFLSKEMVEATDEKTVWNEYYANGNIKSVKTIVPNAEGFNGYDLEEEPFNTNSLYYFEDGTQKTIESLIYKQHGDYAVFACNYRYDGERIWAIFLKDEEMIVFVNSNNIRKRLAIGLRYNYEIRDNRLRFYNGYEVYGFGGGNVNHYAETRADIYMDKNGNGVTFTNMKKYGARQNVHITAQLTDETLPADLLDFVKDYAHTTRRGWHEERNY